MKERPILFSAPMVLALLDGSKTQTRRIIARPLQHPNWTDYVYFGPSKNDPSCRSMAIECGPDYPDGKDDQVLCPYGAAGDRLYVRETWQHSNDPYGPYDSDCDVFYRADYMDDPHGPDGELSPEGKYRRWRPSIHMPRIASRIDLEIVSVRVEQLQSIGEADAKSEGVDPATCVHGYYDGYAKLWGKINGADSWLANPWVWVIDFKRGNSSK